MGFNINEAIDSAKGDAQCKYDPALKDGPPVGTMPSGATGIAVNWSATTLPVTFRIQIQGVKGATDPNNRWCATIKEGQKFIPFSDFSTTCWNTSGLKYNNEPIDAVAFLVPGTTTAESPFDITIVGFAPGTSEADMPGTAAGCGTRTGTVGQTALQGDATKDKDASTQRAVTSGKDCKTYIVNNNNWGQPTSSYQKLSFTGNSFTVDAMNGTGSDAPASFPSLYVGGNGQTLNGTFVTWENTFPSKQPTKISALGSVNSTFKWSGKSSGDFNTSYDIWFSKTIPTAGSYNDAISGFIMVWLYKPGSRQPIGSVVRPNVTIGGNTFDVWAGPRGNTSTGTDPASRPVISYVAKSTVTSFSGDLKAFFDDAVKAGDTANGISPAFSADWYLTDVFGGFEIWSGGAGLKCDEFTVAVK
jgi:cellulose 1,4-beta-cellobiosidase